MDVEDSHLQSPLHMAAMNGQLASASKLLELGADINKKTIHGYTPLLNAAKKSQHQVMDSLLSRGAEYLPSSDGTTPMHFAIENNSHHCLAVLLKHQPELLSDVISRIESDKVSNRNVRYLADMLFSL